MKHIFFSRIILIVALVLCSFSCTSDLDFEQANDLKIQPVVTTNLAYIKGNESDFVGTSIYSYEANVDFFSSSFIEEDLKEAKLYFRINNTINRSFTFNIYFWDANVIPNALVYYITMTVNPNDSIAKTVIFDKDPSTTNPDLNFLKKTTKMGFSIEMAGPPLTGTGSGRVEMSSSVTAYFDVE